MTETNHPHIGVAISTTGDRHRMRLLQTCTRAWAAALTEYHERMPDNPEWVLLVTVDGTEEDARRVNDALADVTDLHGVYRVGQHADVDPFEPPARMGVAVNKNTGIELLMGFGVEHIFLSDDDAWPRRGDALYHHTRLGGPIHSMVNWGPTRRVTNRSHPPSFKWKWPRGVVLYLHQRCVEWVGGMDERFNRDPEGNVLGAGGHEHVEYSRRVFQMNLSVDPFPSPKYMFEDNSMGARRLWHAEDMPRVGETRHAAHDRQKLHTSIKRPAGYWANADRIMAERDATVGEPATVPYTAEANGRQSATIILDQNI